MPHIHRIYDTDLHFIIDPITRKITSESGKVTLMQNDHASERFTFELPRYIEGHDMLETNVAQVHYDNIDATNKRNKVSDIYEVDDLQLSPDSPDVVICSWLISAKATTYAGALNFSLRFACYSDDHFVIYQWFTDTFTNIKIVGGIYNVDSLVEEFGIDILECWKRDTAAKMVKIYNILESRMNTALCNPRGEYDPTVMYDILDIISHGNRLWICKQQDVIGIEPTKANHMYWQLCVELIPITNAQIDMLDPIAGDASLPSSALTIDELDQYLT